MSVVLDASAIIAELRGEEGAANVKPHLAAGLVSAVNHAEVIADLIKRKVSSAALEAMRSFAPYEIVPFDEDQAFLAGELIGPGKPFNLSLGDRACLALALIKNAKVLTADRIWSNSNFGLDIQQIR